MSRVAVSAPGKAFLMGEYAVLEGHPAFVTAVGVRAVAHRPTGSHDGIRSAVVACAHARAAQFLAARGITVDKPPIVETGGFTMGARKLGLGSSAAVAAAVVGFHLVEHGLDPDDPAFRPDVLSLAVAAHAEAQGGGGSGADVAASVLGGTLRFHDGVAQPAPLPSWLHIGYADAGSPAVTHSFLHAVRSAAATSPGPYHAAIDLLARASATFERALQNAGASEAALLDEAKAFAAIVEATHLHMEGLRRLGALSGAPIVTPAIEAIVAAATEAGLAAKPSGAGGGDLVVVFARHRRQLDSLAERLFNRQGIACLGEMPSGVSGIRVERRAPTNSRLAGFFKLSVADRRRTVAHATGLPIERFSDLDAGSLDMQRANHMVENVLGTLELPLAIATNFRINGRDYLVPMCVEEASVVAAASNAAKMIRAGGGFVAFSDPPWMIGQVQLCRGLAENSAEQSAAAIRESAPRLLTLADCAHPRLLERGGGARELEVRVLSPDMLVVDLLVDCRDAMGANLVNTVAETVAPVLEQLTGWVAGLRILSNLADRRRSHVSARIPAQALAAPGWDGNQVADLVVSASRFADLDPYRATTHNKGIMNGVDAVVLATGNDWRAMEASAHAYAAREGRYKPLATWRRDPDGTLVGSMSLPTAVGVVGGATRVHPVARLALEILDCRSGAELGQVMAAAGLASNLAALRALATEGIQRGHMSLHARSLAIEVGAAAGEVEPLTQQLIACGEIKAERASRLLHDMRTNRD